ncbi:tyrosine-type recombinase/integrase [Pseudoroseomonas globiformis]|uniref:Tyrosine-type recombinase/integrase n=1 Tax=Teichococcus globiformis TaxID=2307229 RepID=A0ABV7FT36_9PROT
MATIVSRKAAGKTTYQAKVRLDGHPPVSRTFPSKAAARAWAGEVEAEMRNGRYAAGSGHTLAEAIASYRTERLPELRDQATTQIHLAWWCRRLGTKRLRDLSLMAISDALAELARQPKTPRSTGQLPELRSPATINRYKATLSAVLHWAQQRGWIAGNPARLVAMRAENNERARFLTGEERVALLISCKQSASAALYPAVVTLLATGARLMEVMRLRWADVDLETGAITIRVSKNGDARRVPLTGETVAVLRAWRDRDAVARLPPLLVFPSEGAPTQPADLRRSWQTALRRAGIRDFRRHDLRHSAASALASAGASLLTIGAILGHRSAAATRRYAHLAEGDLREAIERAATKHKVS